MKASDACRPIVVGLALAASSCGDPDTVEIPYASDYVLTVEPTALEGLTPLSGDPQLTVWVESPAGADPMLVPVERGAPAEGLPPLDAGSLIGLLVEDGGDADAWEPQRTLAWGATVLPDALATGEENVTVDLLLTGWSNPGIWTRSSGEQQRIASGVAMLPDGRAYLFGGTPSDRLDDAIKPAGTPAVRRLDRVVETPEPPVFLPVVLPPSPLDPSGEAAGRAALTATPFPVGDGWRILVAGGRADLRFYGENTADAFVFDPTSETIEATVPMPDSRSAHYAVAMANGDVLLDGGVSGNLEYTRSAFVFQAASQSFTEVALGDDVGTWRRAGASLGSEGVLICGGATARLFTLDDWEAVDTCRRVTLDGRVLDAASLPEPLAGHAMTSLADGRVLLTGGASLLTASGPPAAATRAAYLYDVSTDTWSAVGNLSSPRAGHAALSVPTGGAVIVGGLEGLGTLGNDAEAITVDCAERFDPEAERFVTLPECLGIGLGADPTVAVDPAHGAFVFGGVQPLGEDLAGSTDLIGLVGFGPTP